MSINELMLKSENELTANQKEFLKIHQDIVVIGAGIGSALISLATKLKEMRDKKLFVEAGFNSFEDYSEKALGLKRRQAYNYIKVLESFDDDFVHSNAQIGISKLTLLSSLSDNEKEEIVKNNNLEETSVSELKAQIQKLKDEKQKALKDKDKLNEKIDKLKEDLKVEKNKPAEKIVETVQDPELLSKIEVLETGIKMKEKTISNLRDKVSTIEIKNSEELTKFKLIFDNIQVEIRELKMLLTQIPEEKQDGCKKALKAVGESLC